MTAGRLAFVAVLVLLIYFAPQWMPSSGPEPPRGAHPVLESLKELQARLRAPEPRREEAMQRVLRNVEDYRASLTAEQLAMIEELKSAGDEGRRRRIIANLVNTLEQSESRTLTFREWLADVGTWVAESYRLIQPRAQTSMWFIAVALVLTGFFSAILSFTHVARYAARLGFRLFRVWLVVLSLVAIVLVVVTHANPWASFPSELIIPPLVALVGCAFALRLVDFNYPVWNSLVRGCGAPLISMAFTAVYLNLVTTP